MVNGLKEHERKCTKRHKRINKRLKRLEYNVALLQRDMLWIKWGMGLIAPFVVLNTSLVVVLLVNGS